MSLYSIWAGNKSDGTWEESSQKVPICLTLIEWFLGNAVLLERIRVYTSPPGEVT